MVSPVVNPWAGQLVGGGPSLFDAQDPARLAAARPMVQAAGVLGLVSLGLGGMALYFMAKGQGRKSLASAIGAAGIWYLGHRQVKAALGVVSA